MESSDSLLILPVGFDQVVACFFEVGERVLVLFGELDQFPQMDTGFRITSLIQVIGYIAFLLVC